MPTVFTDSIRETIQNDLNHIRIQLERVNPMNRQAHEAKKLVEKLRILVDSEARTQRAP